ncbi:probable cation-transporting ATPase 13A4 isoform X2 [Polyodon spathula]|uniref:probable cation-transporting ATPase 13A4 isoform X2 n=1 Tax=Polyodon spathula TaxID=7913 RepID=UPI001B7EA685|nr:probable cation-transporting ATPase 13A4 isoform X2 [Polyodon spathula]
MGPKTDYIDGHRQLINTGEENEMEVFGYKTQSCRQALCIVGGLLTCGFLFLLLHWKPEWNVWTNCTPCCLEQADVVLLRTTDDFQSYRRKAVLWVSLAAGSCDGSGGHPEAPILSAQMHLLKKNIVTPELKFRFIQVQRVKYIWDLTGKQFVKVQGLDDSLSSRDIHSLSGDGLSKEEQEVRRVIVGPNTIHIDIPPIWKLLFKEVLNPFYVFQVFSVILWFTEQYIEYAITIVIMSVISLALSVYHVRQQSLKLHSLVAYHNNTLITVCRKDEGWKEVLSSQLVPGDIFQITGSKQSVPCDAILLSGGCVVNESMLTGESIPVVKLALSQLEGPGPWMTGGSDSFKRHILFCGTQVIQTRTDGQGVVRAVVLRTGFNTAKGQLVRSIMYPKPTNFKLYRDASRFLVFLITTALLGVVYSVCVWSLNGESAGQVISKALDVITIAVPPALPAALTVGILYAQRRLSRSGVFCISPQRINMCGQMNLVCFDKTGTLTEDGLDLWGLSLAKDSSFAPVFQFSPGVVLPWGPSFVAMVTCHSLILIDGVPQGDPLELKMFEATAWVVDEDAEKGTQSVLMKPGPQASKAPVAGVLVLQQFPFSSGLQRMSVLTLELGSDELVVYLKGAPEKVASLCRPETVPASFPAHLSLYTQQGFRVIGMAYRSLGLAGDLSSISREAVESELTFLGLLILENRLKPETRPVLQELSSAHIRSVMVTGDNLETAVTVANDSEMVPKHSRVIQVEAAPPSGSNPASVTWRLLVEPKHNCSTIDSCVITELDQNSSDYHFVMTGKTYEVILRHFHSLLPKLLLNGTVFARMSPGQKTSLVEEFQRLEFVVGMCGDGANDCGALKMAHAGISLSEQDASVASPFTSKIGSIECVPLLIREGRAALVTSYCMFKYMALYSMSQYLGVLLLYWQLNSFGNYQFLFEDLAINTVIGFTMNLNHAHPKLAPRCPPAKLMSPPMLLSVVLNIMLSLALQIVGFLVVQQQAWYLPNDIYSACAPGNASSSAGNGTHNSTLSVPKPEPGFKSYENTTVWLLSLFSCIMVAFVFSRGKPFRKAIYTNYLFVLVLLSQLAVCLVFLFADVPGLYQFMDLVCTPTAWRLYILVMLVVYFVVALAIEEFIIENRALWWWLRRCAGVQSQSCYRKLQRALEKEADWPPISGTQYAGSSMAFDNTAFEEHMETGQ